MAVINKKKHWIAFVLSLLLVMSVLVGCSSDVTTDEGKKAQTPTEKTAFSAERYDNGMEVAAENENYALMYDEQNSIISIKNKRSGYLWKSSPDSSTYAGVTESDTISEIMSSVILHYYEGSKLAILSSHKDSVLKKQVAVYAIEGGLRVEYVIGEEEVVDIYPQGLTAEYVEQVLLPQFEQAEAERFHQYYTKFVYSETEPEIRDEMAVMYKNFPNQDMYITRVSVTMPIRFRRQFKEALKRAGLTAEVLEREYQLLGYDHAFVHLPRFFVPVEYRLREDHLEATIPFDEVDFDEERFLLSEIDFMPYFGASPKREDGYIFYPDGMGCLMQMDNNGKDAVSLPIYGNDLNYDESQESLIRENTHLPVFGIKHGNEACLTVLSEGEALAEINVFPRNNPSQLNYVHARYTIRPRQVFASNGLVNGVEFVRYGAKRYRGNITQSYYFTEGETANYQGMAAQYRKVLYEDSRAAVSDAAVFLESYGVISRKESLLGFQVQKERPLTTTEQLKQMSDALQNGGVKNIHIQYRNWFGDPKADAITTTDRPSKEVGSFKEWNNLLVDLKKDGIQVYPEYDILHSAKRGGAISVKKDAVHSIQKVTFQQYDDPMKTGNGKYLLNRSGLNKCLGAIEKRLVKNKWSGLSLSAVGTELYSDYNQERFLFRTDFQQTLTEWVEKLSQKTAVLTDGANAYLLPYVSAVTDLPVDGSRYQLQDQVVPFLPMVLHGRTAYTTKPINLAYDVDLQFLKAVEYGAALRFSLNYGQSSLVKETGYTALSASRFSDNQELVTSMCRRYQETYKKIKDAQMIANNRLSNQVFETVYDNGVRVLVNYGSEATASAYGKIGAKDFLVAEVAE